MIICCGEALIDMVPEGARPDAFLARPGGCPFTTAIAAARLGSTTRFLGRIGNDFLGESLFERLDQHHEPGLRHWGLFQPVQVLADQEIK